MNCCIIPDPELFGRVTEGIATLVIMGVLLYGSLWLVFKDHPKW